VTFSTIDRLNLISLLVGMFDATPSAELMIGFTASVETGKSITDIANDMDDTLEFQSLYSTELSDDEFAERFVTKILDGNTNAAGLAEGIAAIEGLLASGNSRGEVMKVAVDFLMGLDVSDATYGQAAQALQNKTDVAVYFVTNVQYWPFDMGTHTAVIADVDSTPESVEYVKYLLGGSQTIFKFDFELTTAQDNIIGTERDESFVSFIVDSESMITAGDKIDGGGGIDTLIAEVIAPQEGAVFLETDSVEVVEFRAIALEEGVDTAVQVDAKSMNGTTEFWSSGSTADMSLEVRNPSHQTTLGLRNSGNTNFEVLFDPEYLSGPYPVIDSTLHIEVLDLDGMRTDGSPLLNNPYIGFSFYMQGEEERQITLSAPTPVQTTYEDMVTGMNAILAVEAPTVTATLGHTFRAINATDAIAYEGTTILLTNTGPESLYPLGWTVDGLLPPDSNVYTNVDEIISSLPTPLSQVDIILDNVGNGFKAGDFVAGRISQADNAWSYGLEKFEIAVDRNSWLNEVRSTDNSLREVYLKNIGANGTIQIDVLSDVWIFDATAMKNSVILSATISNKVLDNDIAFSEDNTSNYKAEFNYTTAEFNDSITLEISEDVASHENFELLIDSGAGNDLVTLQVIDSVSEESDELEPLGSVSISTGAGDDIVISIGSSSAKINVGAGNDTVVLSTHIGSRESIVFTGTENGNVDVLNFSVGGGVSADKIVLSSYLTTQTNVTSESQALIALSVNAAVTAAEGDVVAANEITVITDFIGTEGPNAEVFSGLTAATLLAAVNSTNIAGESDFANIDEGTLDSGTFVGSELVGNSRDHVVLIENEANEGEYKIFHLTSLEGNVNNNFASAELVGTIDLGEEATFNIANFT